MHPSVVTLDFNARPSQNGEYLNPVGLGHPEFVEINLNALDTAYIFSGAPWNLDRRLGPGGGCDGEASCDTVTAIGDPSMNLNPFPFSDLDPGTQADDPGPPPTGVPVVSPHLTQRGRTLAHWPLNVPPGGVLSDIEMAWPPADPGTQVITATDHVTNLLCTAP